MIRIEVSPDLGEMALGIRPCIIFHHRELEASEKPLPSLVQVEFHPGKNQPASARTHLKQHLRHQAPKIESCRTQGYSERRARIAGHYRDGTSFLSFERRME
jgi:hypothetical protein